MRWAVGLVGIGLCGFFVWDVGMSCFCILWSWGHRLRVIWNMYFRLASVLLVSNIWIDPWCALLIPQNLEWDVLGKSYSSNVMGNLTNTPYIITFLEQQGLKWAYNSNPALKVSFWNLALWYHWKCSTRDPFPWEISCASQRSTLINWGKQSFDLYLPT